MQSLSFSDTEISLLKALSSQSVKFAVVGGFAVLAHGVARQVGDLDILVLPTQENAALLVPALAAIGFILTPDLQRRIASPKARCRLPPFNAELLSSIEGVSSSSVIADAIRVQVNGIVVPIMSKAHLIASKSALGRPKDIVDVKGLRACSDNRA